MFKIPFAPPGRTPQPVIAPKLTGFTLGGQTSEQSSKTRLFRSLLMPPLLKTIGEPLLPIPVASKRQRSNLTVTPSASRLASWRGPALLFQTSQSSNETRPWTGSPRPLEKIVQIPRWTLSKNLHLRYVTSISPQLRLRCETLIARPEQLLLQNEQPSTTTLPTENVERAGSISIPHSGNAPFVSVNTQLRMTMSLPAIKLVPCLLCPRQTRFSNRTLCD